MASMVAEVGECYKPSLVIRLENLGTLLIELNLTRPADEFSYCFGYPYESRTIANMDYDSSEYCHSIYFSFLFIGLGPTT